MKNRNESGNVLFLILIAVALFAALSYAVTQSTRSGGKDSSRENIQMDYSRLISYISGLRNTIVRMTANGIDIRDVNFYPPSSFSTLTANQIAANVYHPNGGGHPFDNFANFSSNPISYPIPLFTNQIENIGTTTSDATGNELMLAIPVNSDLCNFINQKNGYSGSIPNSTLLDDSSNGAYSFNEESSDYRGIVSTYSLPSAFIGKSEGCILDGAFGENVFYAALVER